ERRRTGRRSRSRHVGAVAAPGEAARGRPRRHAPACPDRLLPDRRSRCGPDSQNPERHLLRLSAKGEDKMTLKTITPEEARALGARGAAIVDVRDADEFAREHIPGARNAPL